MRLGRVVNTQSGGVGVAIETVVRGSLTVSYLPFVSSLLGLLHEGHRDST